MKKLILLGAAVAAVAILALLVVTALFAKGPGDGEEQATLDLDSNLSELENTLGGLDDAEAIVPPAGADEEEFASPS